MQSLPKTKDLDELDFQSSRKEKDNELAVKLFQLREHLCSMHEAYNEQVKNALDCMRNHQGRGIIGALSNGNTHISTAFANLYEECDHLLLLTGKKSRVSYAHSSIVADQKNEEILMNAHIRSLGQEISKEQTTDTGTPLSKVKILNKKFKRKREKPAKTVSPSPARTRRKISKKDKGGKFSPSIEDGESEITIRLEEDKTIILPNPSDKIYTRIYSIREVLLHLPKYKGDGMYKLFNYLKDEGRITFNIRTFRRHLKVYEENGKLPNDGILRTKPGRPRDKQVSELKTLNDSVVTHSGHGDNAVKDVMLAIKTKRFERDGYKAKDPTQKTVLNNAFLTIISDERVSEVDNKSLRILSMSRDTAVRSIRTFIAEVAVAIATCFIPGRWHDKPPDDELSDGVKSAILLAEEYFGCECRPIDPRYLFNFDDTGRFQYLGEGENIKELKVMRLSNKSLERSVRGQKSISRSALASDSKVQDIKTKLKVAANANEKLAAIVIEFPIFTDDQLNVPFVVLEIPGFSIGGDSTSGAGTVVGYVILSRKGGKDENGISSSDLVTEWFYKNVLQRFIVNEREADKSAKWTEGADVPIEFRATTLVDSEQSMMSLLKREDMQGLDSKIGNLLAKISAAATGAYQPLDLAKLFGELSREIKLSTSLGNENEIGIKFMELVNDLKDRNILSFKNTRQLAHMKDIVSCVPKAYQKVCTRDTLQDAFVRGGRMSRSVKNENVIVGCLDIDRMMDATQVQWNEAVEYECPKSGAMKTCPMKEFVKMQLPSIISEFCDNRQFKVSEDLLEKYGIRKDKDMDGNVVERNGTDDDYCISRAMIIHHKNNRDRINNAIHLTKTRQLQKRISEHSKLQAYHQQNKECEILLRQHAKVPHDALLSSIPIDSFAKPVKNLLIAFCKVRHHADLKSCHKAFPTLKGKLEDCYDNITTKKLTAEVKNLIHYAYTKRANPIIAEDPSDLAIEEDNSNLVIAQGLIDTAVINLSWQNEWVVSNDFIRNACQHISSLADKSDDYKEQLHTKLTQWKSNNLATKYLLPRYASLIKMHNLSESHYTVKWFERNINQAAIIVKMHGYLLEDDDLRFITSYDGLFITGFANNSDIMKELELHNDNSEQTTHIGTYLNIDSRSGKVRRSGSTTTSFRQRIFVEHAKAARLKTDESKKSKFYCSYPFCDGDKDKEPSHMAAQYLQRGWWSDIKSIASVRWRKEDSENVVGMFEWDDRTVERLKQNRSELTLEKKKERMVVYLFETVLALCIKDADNISSNPSFELFNGRFSGGI